MVTNLTMRKPHDRIVIQGQGKAQTKGMMIMKICSFEGCDRKVYAKALCRAHYDQRLRGSELKPIKGTVPKEPKRQCLAPGCERDEYIYRLQLCQGHYQQHRLKGLSPEEMKPVQIRNGFLPNGNRICVVCGEEKPVTEYYVRNRNRNKHNFSGACKPCYGDKQAAAQRARLTGDVDE